MSVCGKNSVNHGSGGQENSSGRPRQTNLIVTGVEGMVFQDQSGALRLGQASFDKGQVTILVAAVKLVADNGMAKVREMDAELVLASCAGDEAEKGKRHFTPTLSPLLADSQRGEGEFSRHPVARRGQTGA